MMQVSVIIPVFNAERFVANAVASALMQPETTEILLIEDCSSDRSYEICRQLSKDPRVRLLVHPGHVNMGAAASRNLGIREAQMPYIAFLDADDTWLPGRFTVATQVFDSHPDADGVHEMIGVQYHHITQKEKHLRRTRSENTGIRIVTTPEKLFQVLATGKYGHIHLNGIVLRKNAITEDLLFDTTLVMSEDVDFILRLAAYRRMYQGDPERIVARRGVHATNSVFTNPGIMDFRRQYLQKCIDHKFYDTKDMTGASLYREQAHRCRNLVSAISKPGQVRTAAKVDCRKHVSDSPPKGVPNSGIDFKESDIWQEQRPNATIENSALNTIQ